MSDQFLLLPRIINSAIGGTIAAMCVYPLELMKTRFQTQSHGPGGASYNSIPDAFVKIRKREGFTGLYRGLPFHLLFATPELIINISGNDFFRKLLHPGGGQEISFARQTLAAALTGLAVTSLATPMEFVKIQLQDEGRSLLESKSLVKPELNARRVIRDIITQHGILGPYKGLGACILRDVPFSIIYFPLFAFLYKMGPEYDDGRVSFAWTLLSGMIAASTAGFWLTPVDVVKTRIQTTHATGENVYCSGIVDCFRSVYRKEGITAFFRGSVCRVLINAPLLGITEMIYYFGVAEYLLNKPIQTFVR